MQPRTHWLLGDETVVDGPDFYVGEHELGHVHLDATAHIPQAKAVANALVAGGQATRFRWIASWVELAVDSVAARDHAGWLFRLRYDQLCGVHVSVLLDQVTQKGISAGRSSTERAKRAIAQRF